MWLALSPIVAGLSGVGQRLKAAAQHWLAQTNGSVAADRSWGAANEPKATATVLPFPLRGEALLLKLATHLKEIVENDRLRRSPFLFAIMHAPHALLLIDEMAHVEFDVVRSEYRIQVLVTPETRVTTETSDFDVVVDFIAQYMRDRLVDTSALEVAS